MILKILFVTPLLLSSVLGSGNMNPYMDGYFPYYPSSVQRNVKPQEPKKQHSLRILGSSKGIPPKAAKKKSPKKPISGEERQDPSYESLFTSKGDPLFRLNKTFEGEVCLIGILNPKDKISFLIPADDLEKQKFYLSHKSGEIDIYLAANQKDSPKTSKALSFLKKYKIKDGKISHLLLHSTSRYVSLTLEGLEQHTQKP